MITFKDIVKLLNADADVESKLLQSFQKSGHSLRWLKGLYFGDTVANIQKLLKVTDPVLVFGITKILQPIPDDQLDNTIPNAEEELDNTIPNAEEELKIDETTTQINRSNELAEIEDLKKDISQLLFIKGLISPLDFERKMEISQKIQEIQKKIDNLNFYIIENKLSKKDIFDDLFEQSFTPISHQYNDVYAKEDETDFFTPNGQPTKLSDELNQIIRTKQFKEWFGDWELSYIYKQSGVTIDCSEVLSSGYEPLLVWHGTGDEFSFFKFDTFPVAYFAVNKAYSQFFADIHGGDEGYVIPFFLNIRKALDLSHFGTKKITTKEFFNYMYLKTGLDMDALQVNPLFLDPKVPELETWVYLRNNPKMLKIIADSKIYDGIHFYETNPSITDTSSAMYQTEVYIIFNANQCKIAAPNRGLLLLSSLKSFLLKRGGQI